MAIALAAVAAACSAIIGAYSYRVSYKLQIASLLRNNTVLAQHLARVNLGLPPSAGADALTEISARWAATPRDDPAMFFCVVSREGKLLANSQRPDQVGHDVSGVIVPATPTNTATTIGKLAAERGEWSGENTDSFGQPQLIAFEYSPALDGLVAVHTPASAYLARVRRATLPWVVGFAVSTLLMWPTGLFLMNLAYDGARKRADAAERDRRASEQRFESIFDQAAIGVAIIHSESGRFVRINEKYESLIGFTNDEIRSKTWQEITHPDDVQPDIERMDLLMKGKLREFELQKRLIRGDGTMMWVNLTVSPSWPQGQDGQYHIAIIEDITDRRQAELALTESEHRFRTLVEHAPEAIVVFDADQRRFVDFNDNALRMFGTTSDEMTRLTPVDLSPRFQPDGRDSAVEAQKLIDRALAGETPIQEWIHCDRQGGAIVSEIRLVRLYATGRRLVRGSITDISDRKRTEERFRQQQAELTHISRLSVMGEMVAGIAHEINQPLFAIANYAHTCGRVLGSEDVKNPDVLEWCGDIEREATRAAEILRRLRDFTRKAQQPSAAIDVNGVVRETIALLMLDSRRHQVAIRTELTDEEVMIQADAVGLQQVFVNLILNACESLAESDVEDRRVTVRTEQRGSSVEIAVIDNGPGFTGGDCQRAFNTFYSTKTDGMGMGLSISRTLIEAHGGTLAASNGASGGAVLRITLPRLEGVTTQEFAASHA